MSKRYKARIKAAYWRTDLWRDDDTFGLQLVVEFDNSVSTLEFYGETGQKLMRELGCSETSFLVGKEIAILDREGWIYYDGVWTEEGYFRITEPTK